MCRVRAKILVGRKLGESKKGKGAGRGFCSRLNFRATGIFTRATNILHSVRTGTLATQANSAKNFASLAKTLVVKEYKGISLNVLIAKSVILLCSLFEFPFLLRSTLHEAKCSVAVMLCYSA